MFRQAPIDSFAPPSERSRRLMSSHERYHLCFRQPRLLLDIFEGNAVSPRQSDHGINQGFVIEMPHDAGDGSGAFFLGHARHRYRV